MNTPKLLGQDVSRLVTIFEEKFSKPFDDSDLHLCTVPSLPEPKSPEFSHCRRRSRSLGSSEELIVIQERNRSQSIPQNLNEIHKIKADAFEQLTHSDNSLEHRNLKEKEKVKLPRSCGSEIKFDQKKKKGVLKKTRSWVTASTVLPGQNLGTLEGGLDIKNLEEKVANLDFVKEKRIKSFNKSVITYLEKEIKKKEAAKTPNEIDELGFLFTEIQIDKSFENGQDSPNHPANIFDKKNFNYSKDIFDNLQTNGILWRFVSKRLHHLKNILLTYLIEKKGHSKWTDFFLSELNLLLQMTDPIENSEEQKGTIYQLKDFLDYLNSIALEITNKKHEEEGKRQGLQSIYHLLLLGFGNKKQESLQAMEQLRKWTTDEFKEEFLEYVQKWRNKHVKISNITEQEHWYYEHVDEEKPIDAIRFSELLNIFIRSNTFLLKNFTITNKEKEKTLEMNSLLFTDTMFISTLFDTLIKNQKEQENSEYNDILNLIFNAKSISFNFNHQNQSLISIDWCSLLLENSQFQNIILSHNQKNGKTLSKLEGEEEVLKRFHLITVFLSLSKKKLKNKKFKRFIEALIDSKDSDNHYTKQLMKFQHQLNRMLCKNLSEKDYERLFTRRLFTEIYKAGFDPSVKKKEIPQLVEAFLARKNGILNTEPLFKHQLDKLFASFTSEEEKQNFMNSRLFREIYSLGSDFNGDCYNKPDSKLIEKFEINNLKLKKMMTLLRFCSNGGYGPADSLCRYRFPKMHESPLTSRKFNTHGNMLAIVIENEDFKVIHSRMYRNYPRKYPHMQLNTCPIEEECLGEILYHWTLWDNEEAQSKGRKGLLQIRKLEIFDQADHRQKWMMLDALIFPKETKYSRPPKKPSSRFNDQEKSDY